MISLISFSASHNNVDAGRRRTKNKAKTLSQVSYVPTSPEEKQVKLAEPGDILTMSPGGHKHGKSKGKLIDFMVTEKDPEGTLVVENLNSGKSRLLTTEDQKNPYLKRAFKPND